MEREIEKKGEDPIKVQTRQFLRKYFNGTVGMLHSVGYESDQSTMSVGDGIRRKRGRPSTRNDDSAGSASAPRRSSQRSSALRSSTSSTPRRVDNTTPVTSPESDSDTPLPASTAPSPASNAPSRNAPSFAVTNSVPAVLRSGPATLVANLNRSSGGSTVQQVAPNGSMINQIASRALEFQARRGSGSDSDQGSLN